MTHDQVQTKLATIRDNLEKLERIPQDTLESFLSDFRNLDSALHRLQTTVQALIDIAAFVVARAGLATPTTSRELLRALEEAGLLPEGSEGRFGPMFGFRNRVVHLYDRIDPEIVYRVLTEDRVEMRELSRLLLEALGRLQFEK